MRPAASARDPSRLTLARMTDMEDAQPQVFAAPAWLRFVNIPTALMIATLVTRRGDGGAAGWSRSGRRGVPGCGGGVAGIRAARSRIVLTRDTVAYRDVPRSRRIRRANVVAYSHAPGMWSWFVILPMITFIDDDGRSKWTRLWCFVVDSRQDIGAGRVQADAARLGGPRVRPLEPI